MAADHRLTETETRIDDHLRPLAGGRVRGEENARDFGGDHDLRHHRHRHRRLVDAVLMPVRDSSLGPKRSPAVLDRRHEGFSAPHVQVRLLLAGKGQVGQILGIGG